MKKNVAFTLISFPVELEANWQDQNVNELEFELSRM